MVCVRGNVFCFVCDICFTLFSECISVLSVQCGDCLELEPRHSSRGMRDQAEKRRGSMYLGKPYPHRTHPSIRDASDWKLEDKCGLKGETRSMGPLSSTGRFVAKSLQEDKLRANINK